jgi:S-DNA-T family DNA segregation ATPase FtsK/SpoIIIE
MQIRLSVTSSRGAGGDAAAGVAPAEAVTVDVAVGAAAGTPFGAAAGTLRTLTGLPDARFHCGRAPVTDDLVLGLPPLVDGAALTTESTAVPTGPSDGPQVHIVGGPDAGGVHLLTPPEPGAPPVCIPIGRGTDAAIRIDDPDLSRLHAELLVTADWVRVRDIGSTNGTTLDGMSVGTDPVLLPPDTLVRLGETTLALRPSRRPLEAEPDRLGRLTVRTERVPLAPIPAPRIELPPRPGARGLPAARKRAATAFEQAKAEAETRIGTALAAEAALRRERHPDLAALLTAAVRPGPGLWTRDPELPGFLELRLGTARVPSRVAVVSGPKTFRPRVAAAPITVDLAAAGVLGLVGPRAAASGPGLDGLARALVGQLAASCAPADLELVVLCGAEAGGPDRSPGWAWTRWLPHLTPQDGRDCRALVGLDRRQVAARLAELGERIADRDPGRGAARGESAAPWNGRRTVVVIDSATALLGERGMRRLLEEGPRVGVYSIVLASRPAQLPDATGAMVVLGGEVNTRLRLERPERPALDGVIADLASAGWAERFARALAPLREPDGFAAPQLPEEARLLSLLDLDLLTPAKLSARWAEPRPGLTLGSDDHGAVNVDLAGQHILVGGASGSGVSEALRSIACALAAVHRPERLRLMLVSGGRGPSLADCALLPHVDAHLEQDCASDALRGLLDRLEAEIEERADAAGSGAEGGDAEGARPRLLIVVDGFDRLAADHPWFAKSLGAIARDGREHGVHLAIGVALDDAQAVRLLESEVCDEAQIRIALRTHGPEESRRLVSLPGAAAVRADTPGRARLALPDGRVLTIQAPRISGRMPSSATARASVVRTPWTQLGSPAPRRPAQAPAARQGPTDLALFVETARRAASR